MGFWDVLGRIAGVAAPVVAAPFTGGASLAALPSALGKAVGSATTAAGNNRLNQESMALQANRDNIAGTTASETALQNRAREEAAERRASLIDVARASDTRNPNHSEFNTHAPKQYSDAYMQSLTALEQAGMARLKANPTYSTDNQPAFRTYKPLNIQDLEGATNTKPGIFERIGQFAGPALSIYGAMSGARGNGPSPGESEDDINSYSFGG